MGADRWLTADGPEVQEGPSQAKIEPRYFTLEDVATYLNVSKTQVYSLVRAGELPAIKLGGRGIWRVDRAKLEDYLERLEQETAEWARAHPLGRERNGEEPDAG